MSRKIEWQAKYGTPDEQQNAFVDEYLTWSAEKRWKYLLELSSQGIARGQGKKGERRIEWK